jgi:hypothetical protein
MDTYVSSLHFNFMEKVMKQVAFMDLTQGLLSLANVTNYEYKYICIKFNSKIVK